MCACGVCVCLCSMLINLIGTLVLYFYVNDACRYYIGLTVIIYDYYYHHDVICIIAYITI